MPDGFHFRGGKDRKAKPLMQQAGDFLLNTVKQKLGGGADKPAGKSDKGDGGHGAIVRRGTRNGWRVVLYADGTIVEE